MEKEYIEISELDEFDREWFLNETWCDKCDKADLGLMEPVMYREDGTTYISGKCVVCGEPVISEIIIKDVDG